MHSKATQNKQSWTRPSLTSLKASEAEVGALGQHKNFASSEHPLAQTGPTS
jgi:hypothetical protein